jgi:hypothetical protein
MVALICCDPMSDGCGRWQRVSINNDLSLLSKYNMVNFDHGYPLQLEWH